tara:strand:+ start:315 stop:422 length:108 start_codon:yes stop_codon:yes gene_type:complete
LHDLHNGTGLFIADVDDLTKVFNPGAPFIKWENAR